MICGRPSGPGPIGTASGSTLAPNIAQPAAGGAPAGQSARGAALASPSAARSASAGRPARRLLDLGLLNFILLLIGTSSLVAGTWNAHRHTEVADLRGVRDRLERERIDLEAAIADERRWYEGIDGDPLLRKELLERLLGSSPEGGIPLDEWLRGGGAPPEA